MNILSIIFRFYAKFVNNILGFLDDTTCNMTHALTTYYIQFSKAFNYVALWIRPGFITR